MLFLCRDGYNDFNTFYMQVSRKFLLDHRTITEFLCASYLLHTCPHFLNKTIDYFPPKFWVFWFGFKHLTAYTLCHQLSYSASQVNYTVICSLFCLSSGTQFHNPRPRPSDQGSNGNNLFALTRHVLLS